MSTPIKDPSRMVKTAEKTELDLHLLRYGDALLEAVEQEMTRDERVFLFGLDVDDHRGIQGSTLGLHKKFGAARSFSTPLSEDAMTGVAIGAAMAGLRPIHVHNRLDFLLLCMNQLVNMAAKAHYMYNGQVQVPIVVRALVGRSWGQGGQHSQSLQSFFMHIPGLKVVAPANPHDAKGCLVAAIRDNNPVIMIEHRLLYQLEGYVPKGLYEVNLGQARTLVPGKDITIVGISHMVLEALRAQKHLERVGIQAEVIDPVSLKPLDIDSIVASVKKTGRLIVMDNGWLSCGAGGEIILRVLEALPQGMHQQPIVFARLGFAETTCPTSSPLEKAFYPNSRQLALKAYELVTGQQDSSWLPKETERTEIDAFKGPF